MLCNLIGAREYEECQDDVLVVSGMAGDIRDDALLNYQVGDDKIFPSSDMRRSSNR